MALLARMSLSLLGMCPKRIRTTLFNVGGDRLFCMRNLAGEGGFIYSGVDWGVVEKKSDKFDFFHRFFKSASVNTMLSNTSVSLL